tara:strand:+ start:2386 stop:4533 length:2148 start_codon:yes stop_codon:yes gene_type:complete
MANILETKIRVKELFNTGADETVIDKYIADSGFTIDQIKDYKIDDTKGASYYDRFKIGLSPNFKSSKATVSDMYEGAVPMDKGNFAIPGDNGATVFNPPGFDVGDIFQYGAGPVMNMATNMYGAYKGQQKGSAFGARGRVVGGILGAGGGEVVGGELGDRAFQGMGGEIIREPKEYAMEKVFDFGIGAGSEFASPYLLKLLKAPFSGFTKKSAQKTKENLDIFVKANIQPPSISMVTGNPIMSSLLGDVEYILGNIPVVKQVVVNAGEKLQKDMGDNLVNTANKIVNTDYYVTNITAGSLVKDGIQNSITGFKTTSGKLYNKAFDSASKVAGNDFSAGATNFIAKLDEIATPSGANAYKKITKQMVKDNPELYTKDMIGELSEEVLKVKPSVLQSQTLIKLQEEITDKAKRGLLTFEELRNYRSLIGKKLTNKSLIDDASLGEYKQLYGALSEDLKLIYKEIGGNAYKEFLRADNYYKAGIKRIDDVLNKVNKVDDDKIFNFLLNQSTEGSTYIRTIKKSLTPDEFSVIQNRLIQKLGRTKGGKALDIDSADYTDLFNSETFLTNWNKIDSSAKDFLFSSAKYKGLRKDLDAIAKVAEKVRISGKTFQNPSGTGDSLIGQLSYAGAITTGTLGGLWPVFQTGIFLSGGAKVMTSPKIIRWLAEGTKIANNKGVDGLIKHLGKASTIFAGEDPALQEFVINFATAMQGNKDKGNKK